ncbi:GNAT family N-acetyltransferase [Sporomusa acidovorans]|uniref:N-acetyltransferase domain-containing protein n=1 Tax=Sporomusa acidovorans (strain ATCC 49682 / DSM 3132 / Mol) TaxID=1123286 RepID=A0ABZ3J0S5_SPOA4|nr:GNAT family N-acetyltransferase [Sporomusa acidovorans]OZC24238.1 FR47-like protein [Sporomusa acidovorans DSM 3132]SDF56538.1 hypothetical protein SAMN04488499_105831 [Sporomusa acidovorans]
MIRLLTSDDLPAVDAYLERNYMETAFLSGNLSRYGIENDRLSRRTGDYYGFFANSELQGMLTFYNLGSVVPHFETTAAIRDFVMLLRQRKFEVLVGMKKIVEPLSLALNQYKQIQDRDDSYYFVNYAGKPFSLPDAHQIADVETIRQSLALNFVVEAYREGFKRRFNSELAARLIEDRGQEEAFIFLLVDGMPAAQAMIQVTTGRIGQIGGVYTSESSRGKGYCKALVAELCRRIYSLGKIPTLMVRKDNSPAIRAYQALGFTYYDEYLIVKYII